MKMGQQTACPNCSGAITVRDEMLGRTIHCPCCGQPVAFAQTRPVQPTMSARETYNVVTDLGTGVNLRLKDNLFQLAAITVSVAVGVLIALLVVEERAAGAVVGGFIALVVGLFGSGIFLMLYRFIRHARGRHG